MNANIPPRRITLRTLNNRLKQVLAQLAKLLEYRDAELSRDMCATIGTGQKATPEKNKAAKQPATGLVALVDKPDSTAIQLMLLAKRRPADWLGPRVRPKAGKRRQSGLPERVRVRLWGVTS